jgi:hypothetical protein
MAFEGLITELKRLIRERVPGSQAKESVESFDSAPFLLKARFVSSARTFGSRIAEEYKDGQTIVCEWEGHDLQVALMLLPSANDWGQGRTKGEKFELWARLLSYDTLYDRAIFGHALEEDADEQLPPEPELVPVQPEPELVEKIPTVQPQEVIKRAVRRTARVKLPKKARTRKVPKQRRLYGKSKDVASPKRNKKNFCFKPRKLKVTKRPSSNPKRVGHATPSRKPLKRTLKSVSKANPRRSIQSAQLVRAPKFRVSNRAVLVPPPNPAEIVRILQKKKSRGYRALTEEEHQILHRAGFGCAAEDEVEYSKGCRRLLAVFLFVIWLPCCFSSAATGFGIFCLVSGILLLLPDFVKFHEH